MSDLAGFPEAPARTAHRRGFPNRPRRGKRPGAGPAEARAAHQILWSATVAAVIATIPHTASRLTNTMALRLTRSGYCASSGVSAGAKTEM